MCAMDKGDLKKSDSAPSDTESEAQESLGSVFVDSDQSSVKSEDLVCPRIRLLCSYGGKILPRPPENHLKYVGGERRILVINRDISYLELMGKVAKYVGDNVLLKYQMLDEDLDALISVTSDEDMENMMDEYARIQAKLGSSARLKIFLFVPKKQHVPDMLDGVLEHLRLQISSGLEGVSGPNIVTSGSAALPISHGMGMKNFAPQTYAFHEVQGSKLQRQHSGEVSVSNTPEFHDLYNEIEVLSQVSRSPDTSNGVQHLGNGVLRRDNSPAWDRYSDESSMYCGYSSPKQNGYTPFMVHHRMEDGFDREEQSDMRYENERERQKGQEHRYNQAGTYLENGYRREEEMAHHMNHVDGRNQSNQHLQNNCHACNHECTYNRQGNEHGHTDAPGCHKVTFQRSLSQQYYSPPRVNTTNMQRCATSPVALSAMAPAEGAGGGGAATAAAAGLPPRHPQRQYQYQDQKIQQQQQQQQQHQLRAARMQVSNGGIPNGVSNGVSSARMIPGYCKDKVVPHLQFHMVGHKHPVQYVDCTTVAQMEGHAKQHNLPSNCPAARYQGRPDPADQAQAQAQQWGPGYRGHGQGQGHGQGHHHRDYYHQDGFHEANIRGLVGRS